MPLVFLYLFGVGYPFGGEKQGQGAVERLCGRAHLARQCASSGQSSLGALLRERKVTGRDASLPAPLLLASLGLVGRGTVGALPQTPQGALPLDPARGNPPLDPFARLSWLLLHALPACLSFWCCDLILFPFPFNPHESLSSLRAQSRVSSVHPPSSQYNPTQIY